MGIYVRIVRAAHTPSFGASATSWSVKHGIHDPSAAQAWTRRGAEEPQRIYALRFCVRGTGATGAAACASQHIVVVHSGFQHWLGRSPDHFPHNLAPGAHGLGVRHRDREPCSACHGRGGSP